jgi:hypothetical protein
MYCWMMGGPLHPARIAAVFLNGIMKEENDNGENGSGFSYFPTFVARVTCISSSHIFILQILDVTTPEWRKTTRRMIDQSTRKEDRKNPRNDICKKRL